MIPPRLSHVFMWAADLDKSLWFYHDVLGLQLLMTEPGYVRLGGGGGFHLGMESGQDSHKGIELCVQVPDVDAWCKRVQDARMDIDVPPQDEPWGARHAWLYDPNGYRITIFTDKQ